MAEPERRRRRHRHRPAGADGTGTDSPPGSPAVAPSPADLAAPRPGPAPPGRARGGPAEAATSPVHDPEPAAPVPAPVAGRPPSDERETERGLRGLVGSGSSQVGPRAAMRARDASRPTGDDLAAAERDLAIVRRHWVPREELPRGGR